jgi:hypothetical protein
MRDLLYIDIDDTLIAQVFEGSGFDLRPNVMTQLKVLSHLFDCRWLTYWPAKNVCELMRALYGSQLNSDIHWINWKQNDATNKAVTVLAGRKNFWWLENPLWPEEAGLLAQSGLEHRYIQVAPTGADGFAKGCRTLFVRKGITPNRIRGVGGRIEWFDTVPSLEENAV